MVSILTPIVFGYKVRIFNKEPVVKDRYFNKFNIYHSSEISNYEYEPKELTILKETTETSLIEMKKEDSPSPIASYSLMDSPWPMYCHDTLHTGRSPYSTTDNPGIEIWRFRTKGWAYGSPIIDGNEIIYIGAHDFYSVYPNGTLNWKYDTTMVIESAAAIGENGIVYIGTTYGDPNYMYAFYLNGTLKWMHSTGSDDIFSSPAIGEDGTIYFGTGGGYPWYGYINAVYPNGTQRWRYKTGHEVYSSPAIGNDGIVYCGSHDQYMYALYPNGTLKWKYKTGHWIRTSPCVADDGTIYFVSLDDYLYALYPNGTLKWKTKGCAGTSPTIDQDGTIYCGYNKLKAIYPNNGSVKWTFNVGGTMRGGTPCNSIDGTIYVGTSDGGQIIAIKPNGTEKWRKSIGTCESAPAIGKDGTVYIGSNACYLYAFGIGDLEADADGPYFGLIDEPVQFTGSAIGGMGQYDWFWDFGDGEISEEQNPTHIYTNPGNYTVVFTVTDNKSNVVTDTTYAWIQITNTDPDKPMINGPTNGAAGTTYDYKFTATDPDNSIIYLYVDWGDNTNSGWIGPYNSDRQVTLSHSWTEQDTYTIKAKAKDPYDVEGPWGTLDVTMPKNKMLNYPFLLRMLERLPILQKIFTFLTI
jgi:outer membrane protein assembly factor BamB